MNDGSSFISCRHCVVLTRDRRLRLLLALAIAYLCVSYVLVLYPAWQVVLFWIFFLLAVARSFDFVRGGHTVSQLLVALRPLLLSIVLTAAAVAACLLPALDVIDAVMNTAYPGARSDAGGDLNLSELGDWARSIFSPLAASDQSSAAIGGTNFASNVCEGSSFFSMTPLGAVVALVFTGKRMVDHKKADTTVVVLMVLEVLLFIHCLLGLPSVLTTIMLLNKSTEIRIWNMIGYLDLLLLFRVAIMKRAESACEPNARTGIFLATVFLFSFVASYASGNVRGLFIVGTAVAMFCMLGSLFFTRDRASLVATPFDPGRVRCCFGSVREPRAAWCAGAHRRSDQSCRTGR